MKKFIHLILIAILVYLPARMAAGITDRPFDPANRILITSQETDDFTFVVIGDIRMSFRGRPYSGQTMRMLNEIKMIAPFFVISVGDAYYGYGDSLQQFKDEIDYFISTIKPLDMPFFNIIGNHDIAGRGDKEKYVQERFGNFYGSFDFGNSHFVMLDTDEKGREGRVYGDQLKWLERDLAANKNTGNIFVFMHRPLFSALVAETARGGFYADTRDRDALTALFEKYGVKVVFAGHEHLFKDMTRGGIRYVITAGGGAPLYATRTNGGFFHFLIVKVKGGNYAIEIIEPDSLTINHISGNNGIDQKTIIEVENASSADLDVKNVTVKMPWMNKEIYHVEAVSMSPGKNTGDLQPKIHAIKNNGDGSATVSVGVHFFPKSRVRITVSSGEDK
jgi:hypothetical protein